MKSNIPSLVIEIVYFSLAAFFLFFCKMNKISFLLTSGLVDKECFIKQGQMDGPRPRPSTSHCSRYSSLSTFLQSLSTLFIIFLAFSWSFQSFSSLSRVFQVFPRSFLHFQSLFGLSSLPRVFTVFPVFPVFSFSGLFSLSRVFLVFPRSDFPESFRSFQLFSLQRTATRSRSKVAYAFLVIATMPIFEKFFMLEF